MIFTIAAKELKALFASPLAWIVLTLTQLIVSYGFLQRIDDFVELQPQLAETPNAPGVTALVAAPVYATLAVVMLFAVPLLAMRLIAEERRNQTMVLLVSAPLSITEIVLGKFLGLMLFLLLAIGIITLMPLALLLGGRLDFGLLASLLIGSVLLTASFAAVGFYASALTAQPIIAALIGFGSLLIMLLLVGVNAADGLREHGWTVAADFVQVLSPLNNFDPFARGMFDSYSAVCLLLLVIAFLTLTIRRLDAARLGA
ncbi:MAG TPA: ABC transporter permease [Burkholderiales bacterium]|nr:ABC transporter permease [Burkholderiales bacterium]